MAVHLVLRETRPDAAAGMFVSPLAGHLDRVSAELAARPWPELVDRVRRGPPTWSPFAIGLVDEAVNVGEFFVHHEDVLRGTDAAARRELSPQLESALWGVIGRIGKVLVRKSPVGVDVRCEGHADRSLTRAKDGQDRVTLIGRPSEVLLRLFGRGIDDPRVVDVRLDGTPDAISRFGAFSPGI